MKIRISELRKIVGRLLAEAPCTSCGDPNAYIGLNSCECPNPECKFFSQRQADDVRPKAPSRAKKKRDTCPERPECGGEGSEPCDTCGRLPDEESCEECEGSGVVYDDRGNQRMCGDCNGMGTVDVDDGEKCRECGEELPDHDPSCSDYDDDDGEKCRECGEELPDHDPSCSDYDDDLRTCPGCGAAPGMGHEPHCSKYDACSD